MLKYKLKNANGKMDPYHKDILPPAVSNHTLHFSLQAQSIYMKKTEIIITPFVHQI